MQFNKGEFGCSINSDEHVQLAFRSLHLRNVYVEIADRVGLELLLRRPVAFDIGKSADPMTLQAAVQ